MAVTAVSPTPVSECKHRWQIESPNGPASPGICRKCGSQREFLNSFDVGPRENNTDVFDSPKRRRRRNEGYAEYNYDIDF